MKNKKTFITVCVAAICLAVFFITKPMLKDINGEEYFNFAQFNEEYALYVIRENKEVQDFTDGEHRTEHKEYLLNEEQTAELFDFVEQAGYKEYKDFNLLWLHPGIKSVTSVSTTDAFGYRIILRTSDGEELLHIFTCGDDYIAYSNEWIEITEKDWGPQVDAIIADAQLMDTYFR
ncbi:MAG: hypothetical protein IJ339_01900 [Oscillospiraceae bacterium]|nr:hypothetical protein [Oscillospiraceae bacterium]